jgi:X-Pro dipeptidyl-peptidase
VTKGVLDAGHRTSRYTTTPIVADQRYPFSFPLLPYDYTFPVGHQIGVVIEGSYRDYGTTASNTGAAITFSLKNSRITLPIVGGGAAALAAGISGGEPTTTSVTSSGPTVAGAPATFTATVTGNDAALTAAPLPPDLMAEALRKADFDGFTKLGTVGGAVQFYDADTPVGAPVALDANGVARLTTSALGGGSHQITAKYLGEGAYDASAATISQVVGVPGDVGATVPATLALTLGAPAAFGPFTPGIDHTYTATTTANVISTAGDATLSVADPSAVSTGHLVNGTFALPEALGGLGVVKTWSAPVSNDPVTVTFTQHIGATDALRTGAYTKTLTFTLSTTTP